MEGLLGAGGRAEIVQSVKGPHLYLTGTVKGLK